MNQGWTYILILRFVIEMFFLFGLAPAVVFAEKKKKRNEQVKN